MNDVVTELTIDARGAESGSAVYVRAMQAAQRAVDGVIDREQKAQEAIQRQTAVMVTQAGSISRTAREWDKLRQTADPALAGVIARQRDLERATLVTEQAVKRGLATQEQAAAVLARYREQLDLAAGKVQAFAAANDNLAVRMAAQAEIARRAGAAQQAAAAQAGINARFGATDRGVAPGRADDIAAYGSALDQLRSKYNPIFAASRQYKDSLIEIAQAAKVGAINEQERLQAIAAARAQMASQVAAIKGVKDATEGSAVANDNVRRTSGLARHELINLSRQIQDVGVSLASGQSPFTVLVQQGTQIADVFASSQGTVGGFFRQMMSYVTPVRALSAAVLAVGIASGIAFMQWSDGQRELSRSTVGLGRDANLTREQMNRMASEAASRQGLSTSQSRAFAGQLAGTGRLSQAQQGFLNIQRDFAATLGVGMDEAANVLSQAFKDPIRGAEMLHERLGGLTNSTRDYIRMAVAAGDEDRARVRLLETFAPRLGRAAELTSVWARAWEAVKSGAGGAFEAVGRAIERATTVPAKTPEQQAQDQLDAAIAKGQGQVTDRTNGRGLGFGLSGPFGPANDEVRLRQENNREIERARANLDNVRMAQERVNEAVALGNYATARRAEQERAMEGGTQAATRMAIPEQAEITRIKGLVEGYAALRTAREAAYQTQSEEGGFERYRAARDREQAARRALRESVQPGTRLFDRDGNLLLTQTQILERRLTLQQQLNQANDVERQGITAITAGDQARANASRIRHQAARDPSAGGPALVEQRAQIEAANTLLRINTQLTQAGRERIWAANDNIEALRRETTAMGASVGEQERLRLEQQMLTEAKREYRRLGLTIPESEVAAIRAAAAEMGRLRQEQALARAQRDVTFDRQTIGLSESDRRIAHSMRELYGDAWQGQMNSALAGQTRFNDALRQGADYAVDFARGFTQDLRNGVGVLDALGNAFLRVGQRIVDAQIEQMIRGLFGIGGGSSGLGFGMPNLLGEFFGMFGFMPGMSEGGYTGPGGVHQPHGLVHKGEVVWSQRDVARAGGVAMVEAMRLGMPGYAAGGAVGYRPPPTPSNSNWPMREAASGNVIINNNGAPVTATSRRDGHGNTVIDLEEMKEGMTGQIASDITRGRGSVGKAISSRFGIAENGNLIG